MARNRSPYDPQDPYGAYGSNPYDAGRANSSRPTARRAGGRMSASDIPSIDEGSAADASPYSRRSSTYSERAERDAYELAHSDVPPMASSYAAASPSRSRQASPYDQQDDDASHGATAPRAAKTHLSRKERRAHAKAQARAAAAKVDADASGVQHPVGVRPVTRNDYVRDSLGYAYQDGPNSRKSVSRRSFIAAGVCLGVAAVVGGTGYAWWTHRAVACEVNGTERSIPVGAPAQKIIEMGYANPQYGNLVSISDATHPATVLKQGGGKSYTLVVNGQETDVDTYRAAEGDTIEFKDGDDVVEDSVKNETRTPCGVQFRSADGTYMDPNEATSRGIYLATIGCVAQWGKEAVSTVETGSVSGTVIDHGVTQEAQDLVIAACHLNPTGDKPMIALTFDDGPSETYTGQYLDILAQYGAKATFFNLGQNAEEYPEICKRCVDEGHQVSSHTYSHQNLPKLSVDQLQSEIKTAYDAIEKASGERPSSLRPPYGEFYCKQFLETLGDMTYTAYWSVDSEDWTSGIAGQGQAGADAIVANCTKGLNGTNYNGAVILMHDGGGDRSADVLALPALLQTFISAGYEFVTLDDLIKADPTIPAWVSGGDASVPADAYIPDLSAYV